MRIQETVKANLESNRWIPIPGTDSLEIYPIIRKPCVTCSNTFILKSPWFVVIVDPGADTSQIEHIRSVCADLRRGRDYPVYLFLTHCHIDHYLAAHLLMDEDVRGRLVCHAAGSEAIENRDEGITLAHMNGSTLPHCRVSHRLFEPAGKDDQLTEGHPFFESGILEIEGGRVIPLRVLSVSETEKMEIIHTPGHSPDGLSYRVGSLLITGDLHLATTPGIAGKAGWDNERLAVSLAAILEEGRRNGISHILPGHGNILPFSKAEKIFEEARKTAVNLKGLALFDRERSSYISEYAVVLLEEAGNIFSIIAGRLLKVAYYLEMLEEYDNALEVMGLIDHDEIERTLDDFHAFVNELKEKRGAPLISKAVQVVRKVEKVFLPDKIATLFDEHFIHRIRSLLSDFVNVVYGIRYADQETLFNLSDTVTQIISSIQTTPIDQEKIFDTLDDNREFVNELARRIAHEPLFSSMRFSLSLSQEELSVYADKSIFQDMFTALLEQFAISKISHVLITAGCDVTHAFLDVSVVEQDGPFTLRQSKLLYLQHSMIRAGGRFEEFSSNDGETYRFALPVAIAGPAPGE